MPPPYAAHAFFVCRAIFSLPFFADIFSLLAFMLSPR